MYHQLTLKEAYMHIKGNIASGFDDINSNVIKITYNELSILLLHDSVFNKNVSQIL